MGILATELIVTWLTADGLMEPNKIQKSGQYNIEFSHAYSL